MGLDRTGIPFLVGSGLLLISIGCGGHSSSSKYRSTAAGSTSATTGQMEARADHRSVTLASGEILLVGGVDAAGQPLTTTALLTVSGATVNTVAGPQMASARTGHTATLLGSGQVLVVGGHADAAAQQVSDTTELFDPLTNTFAAGPTLGTARTGHAAAIVDGGTGPLVLIAGGRDASGAALGTAELIDPATGAVTPVTGTLTNPQAELEAVRLPTNQVLLVGDAGAELFDPATQTFAPAGGAARSGAAVALATNEVLVAGGADASGTLLGAEVYTNAFGAGPALTPRRDAAAAVIGNVVAVVGGRANAALGDVALFAAPNLANATVVAGPSLTTPRWGHTVEVRPDTLIVIGGRDASGRVLDSVEVVQLGSLPSPNPTPAPGPGPGLPPPNTGPGVPGPGPGPITPPNPNPTSTTTPPNPNPTSTPTPNPSPTATPTPTPTPGPAPIATYPYSENFDSGLGAWSNATGDDFDWTERATATTSTQTGPSADHTGNGGNYVYTESSSPNYPTKVAILSGPSFTNFTTLELRFWYHMYGSSMGTLKAQVSTNGGASWTDVWTLSGDQGDQWSQAAVDLSSYAGQTIQVRFHGETSTSYRSDMAIDDVVLDTTVSGPAPTPTPGGAITTFPYSENFDNGLGAWTQPATDDFDWTERATATTSTATGPSADHTGNGGNYVYTESSSPNYGAKVALLEGPAFAQFTTLELRFWYHMYGATMGTLDAQVSTNNGATWTTVWTMTGDQGNQWRQATVDLSSYAGQTVKVRFQGTTGTSYTSDMAVDDVVVDTTVTGPNPNPTPGGAITTFPYVEDFDSGLGAWSNATGDDFDWTERATATTSLNTGPSADHTGSGGNYVYTESSSPNFGSKVAILSGPTFAQFNSLELRFWYHMYGATMGTLKVQVSTNGGTSWTDVWTLSGDQGNQWNQASVDLSSYAGQAVTVRFHGTTGTSFTSDIAIDDVRVDTVVLGPPTTTINYTEDFDTGMGQWSDAAGDDTDWTRQSGSTTSINTGPSSGNGGSGSYVYIEASSPNYPSKTAILNGPSFNNFTTLTATFQYHMYGAAMGTLKLQVSTNGGATWTDVWSRTGDQGNQWSQATVNLSSYAGQNVQLRFHGTTGTSFTSDMAIDDVTVTGQ